MKKKQRIKKIAVDAPQSIPPWQHTKTKQQAWQEGYERGRTQGAMKEHEMLKAERQSLNTEAQRLDALKHICQGGSNVIEAMCKALLSYDKNL